MLTKNHIIKSLQHNKPSLAKYGVKKLGLFGSYVRDAQQEQSDIDILIDFDSEQETFDNLMSVNEILEKAFMGYNIEVVTKNGLSKHIGSYILDETEYV